MTHVMTYEHGAARREAVGGTIARWRKALADWRRYRQTYAELAAMSDRELADIGLSRISVDDVARDSVYGA